MKGFLTLGAYFYPEELSESIMQQIRNQLSPIDATPTNTIAYIRKENVDGSIMYEIEATVYYAPYEQETSIFYLELSEAEETQLGKQIIEKVRYSLNHIDDDEKTSRLMEMKGANTMMILGLLGRIIDDMKATATQFDRFEQDTAVTFCACNDAAAAELRSLIDIEAASDFAIIIEPNQDRYFEVKAIEYTTGTGEEITVDVGESIRQYIESIDMIEVYHTLCEAAVNT